MQINRFFGLALLLTIPVSAQAVPITITGEGVVTRFDDEPPIFHGLGDATEFRLIWDAATGFFDLSIDGELSGLRHLDSVTEESPDGFEASITVIPVAGGVSIQAQKTIRSILGEDKISELVKSFTGFLSDTGTGVFEYGVFDTGNSDGSSFSADLSSFTPSVAELLALIEPQPVPALVDRAGADRSHDHHPASSRALLITMLQSGASCVAMP